MTPDEIEATVDRVRNEIALHSDPEDPPGFQRFLDDVSTLLDAAERLAVVEQSMARHFAEEHLAGDGPEIDRLKRRLAVVEGEHRVARGGPKTPDVLLTFDQAIHEVERLSRLCDEHYRRAKQAERERDAFKETLRAVQAGLVETSLTKGACGECN